MRGCRSIKGGCRKGFTLIEFLIALVIIGFITTLLVSYFGNPLEEAKMRSIASKYLEGMRSVAEAEGAFSASHAGKYILGGPDFFNSLVDEHILDSIPTFPATLTSSNSLLLRPQVLEFNGNGRYIFSIGGDFGDPTNAKDVALCKKYNVTAGSMSPGDDVPSIDVDHSGAAAFDFSRYALGPAGAINDRLFVLSNIPASAVGKQTLCFEDKDWQYLEIYYAVGPLN